jgi:hypothetical protein
LPGRLPEIFESDEQSGIDTLYQEFVLAVGLGFLRKESEAGDPAVAFYDPTQRERGGNREVVILGQSMDKLFVEFKKHVNYARASRAGFEQMLATLHGGPDGKDYRQTNLYLQLTSPALLAELLEISRNRSLRDVDGEVARIVGAHFDLLKGMLSKIRVDLEAGRVHQLFEELISQLSREALDQFRSKVNQDTFNRVERLVTNVQQAAIEAK